MYIAQDREKLQMRRIYQPFVSYDTPIPNTHDKVMYAFVNEVMSVISNNVISVLFLSASLYVSKRGAY